MTVRRPRVTALTTILASLLAPLVLTGPPARATGAPALQSIAYLGAPYARVGWVAHDIATVTLTSPVDADTTVSLASSNVVVAVVPPSVTVAAGQQSATVPVTALSTGTTTITATLGLAQLVLTPDLYVGGVADAPNLSAVTIAPASVQPGDPAATGLVVLDFLAPPGGFVVSLASGNPEIQVPTQVVVAEDSDRATFPVTNTGVPAEGVVTASAGGVDRTAPFSVADTSPPQTTITKVNVRQATRKAIIRFTSSEAGSTFLCKLDSASYRSCTSPTAYRHLGIGRHVVRVRAVDPSGNPDPTPAVARFRIKR